MDVRVLGHVEAGNGARTYALRGPTQRRVFAALVARRGEVVDVSALVEVCWPTEAPPDRADHNIRTYVHRLRNALQEDGERLATVGTGYRLDLHPGELDLEDLSRLYRRGSRNRLILRDRSFRRSTAGDRRSRGAAHRDQRPGHQRRPAHCLALHDAPPRLDSPFIILCEPEGALKRLTRRGAGCPAHPSAACGGG